MTSQLQIIPNLMAAHLKRNSHFPSYILILPATKPKIAAGLAMGMCPFLSVSFRVMGLMVMLHGSMVVRSVLLIFMTGRL